MKIKIERDKEAKIDSSIIDHRSWSSQSIRFRFFHIKHTKEKTTNQNPKKNKNNVCAKKYCGQYFFSDLLAKKRFQFGFTDFCFLSSSSFLPLNFLIRHFTHCSGQSAMSRQLLPLLVNYLHLGGEMSSPLQLAVHA